MPVNVDEGESEIAREIARVHQQSYGETVIDPEVTIGAGVVTVVIEVVLSRAEQTLVGAGHTDQVRLTREAYQDAIQATFTAVVERATGRRVVGFANRTIVERDGSWSAEVFRLGRPDAATVEA